MSEKTGRVSEVFRRGDVPKLQCDLLAEGVWDGLLMDMGVELLVYGIMPTHSEVWVDSPIVGSALFPDMKIVPILFLSTDADAVWEWIEDNNSRNEERWQRRDVWVGIWHRVSSGYYPTFHSKTGEEFQLLYFSSEYIEDELREEWRQDYREEYEEGPRVGSPAHNKSYEEECR